MNTLLNTLIASSLAITSTAAFPQNEGIVVSPDAETVAYVIKLSRTLDQRLEQKLDFYDYNGRSGAVQVKFAYSEDGKPDAVAIYRGSGNARLNRIAMRTVQAIGRTHPLPASVDRKQWFLANIIYAKDDHERKQLRSELYGAESRRMASSGPEATFVAIGMTTLSPGG